MQRAWCDTQPVHGLSARLHRIILPEAEPAHDKATTSAGTRPAVIQNGAFSTQGPHAQRTQMHRNVLTPHV